MPDINCRAEGLTLRAAPLWGILGLMMLMSATVWASGHTVTVPPPNGVDDTAKIQGALKYLREVRSGLHRAVGRGNIPHQASRRSQLSGNFQGYGPD